MKLNLKKKLIAVLLGSFLTITCTCSTASAANLFATIQRAGRACSSIQMEQQQIVKRMTQPTYTRTTSGTVTPVVRKSSTVSSRKQLSVFGVYSYIEHGTVHNDYGETVHRSNLPLYALMYEEGYGNIVAVTIDNVGLKSGLVSERISLDDQTPIDEACAQLVVFDDSVIKNLSDGFHNVMIFATNEKGELFSDNFSFVLAD